MSAKLASYTEEGVKTQHELIVAASMTKLVKVAGIPYLSDSCERCPECDGYQEHSV